MNSNEIFPFYQEGDSEADIVRKLNDSYGENFRITNWGTRKPFFSKKVYSATGYVGKFNSDENNFNKKKEEVINLKNDKDVKYHSSLNEIKDMISDLQNSVKSKNSGREDEHKSISEICSILKDNDFSEYFIDIIKGRLLNDLTSKELNDISQVKRKVVDWISEYIIVYDEQNFKKNKNIALVGTTGVGKTTLVGKLIGKFRSEKSIVVFNTDNYKINADKQLETIAECLDTPFENIKYDEKTDELSLKMMYHDDVDLIIIDTSGRSPKDFEKLNYIKKLVNKSEQYIEFFLVISATTKEKDIRDIIKEFTTFNFSSIIFTKLDESFTVGNIISVCNEIKKPIAFLGTGQAGGDLENDIKRYLLNRLIGFDKINKFL